MAVEYGLLKGKVIGGMRAEVVEKMVNEAHRGGDKYRSNHFHILVQAAGQTWRCPVNVRSQDGSEVWFKTRDAFRDHPILDALPGVSEGLHELRERKPGLTLDFLREPPFDRSTMRHLPINGGGANDDVQDHLEIYVNQAKADPQATIYVFGSFWRNRQFPPDEVLNTRQGVHDIHMNQGNDHSHSSDDGIYQDGGVIFHFGQGDRYVGIFLAFNSQVWATDQKGHRLAGHPEGPLGEAPAPAPIPAPAPAPAPEPAPAPAAAQLHVIAAWVNPGGDDVGKETVTLFNAEPAPVKLDGWKLMDRQNKVEDLSGRVIDSNAAITIRLSGKGTQLSNRGGAIRLLDAADRLVDTAIFTEAQAASGRIIVF